MLVVKPGAARQVAATRLCGMLSKTEGKCSLKLNSKTVASLAAAAALMVLVLGASFWAFRQIEETGAARLNIYDTLQRADDLMSAMRDAEIGERGYALTGDETYLQPYLAVRDRVTDQLEQLRSVAPGGAARKHLDALPALVGAKLVQMAEVIKLRRNRDTTAALALINTGQGKRLMDAIRAEMISFVEIEKSALAAHETQFQSGMRNVFAIIVGASVLALLFGLFFVYLTYLDAQHRLANLLHIETRSLLEAQGETNKRLQQANAILQISEENLAVTLNSIGDAVIATDAKGQVTRINQQAECLTGWTLAEAAGRPVDDIFRIINQETRQPAKVPVMETLAHGTTQGLANHTILIARAGSERAIADSCAPIRQSDGQVVGAVLVFRDVTGEFAAQQAVRDSNALLQTVLDTVDDGVITMHARGGIIGTVNHAAERMFGYNTTELTGRNFSMLVPELDKDLHDGSLAYYSASDAARSIGAEREVLGKRRDGSHFPLEIATSEMLLGSERYFTAVLRDITARRQAEEALLKAGALQSAIFNSANFSVIATDAKGVIQIFNVGAERMLGYTAFEVKNKFTPADISDPQEVIARAKALSTELSTPITPGYEALVFKASRDIEDIYELTQIRKDGSRFPVMLSVTALRDAHNANIGYLLIGTDNTARKHIELERNAAMAAAEKASHAKTDFLSNMSHELRTPLNAILGFAQLMESGKPPPTPSQKRSIDQILKAGWYLLELISEVLDLARIESGKVVMSHEPVVLTEVILECRAMVEPQAQRRGIGMTFPQFDVAHFVSADRTRLKQVLINLLFNAVKYNRPGGSVSMECTLVHPGSMRISVRDTGMGLTPQQLAQLFQPFNRLGKETSAEEGTGIGLVVTKRLVELMGGSIGVESSVGVGSVFWVELKLAKAPRLEPLLLAQVALEQPKLPEGTPLRTVLYVEDNPANLELVEQLIERRSDLRLLSAADGNLGIEYARTYQPDVILMDINLPGISGVEVMQILRADPSTKHIPIIAISANAMPRDIEKALAAGFFNYLTKPIKVKEFISALDEALKVSETGPDRAPEETQT